MEILHCDVLVIGGGGAAGRAAIAAHDAGADVLMAVKGRLGGGATGFSMSEMAGYNSPDGAADPSDSPEAYYNDIMEAGMGMADPEAARVLAENAQPTVAQLEDWGVRFERNPDGGFFAFLSCYSSKARTHVIKGHGEPIVKAQGAQIAKRGIRVREGLRICSLAVRDGVARGAVGLDADGKKVAVAAGAAVMATGGATQAITRNMNPPEVTGDGCAMAYRAGAELVNMEFMQAGLGFSHPACSLINAYIWGGHPVLSDASGAEFMRSLPDGLDWRAVMDEHRKHFPFSSRDISRWLESSVQREIAEGRGTAHGGVRADFRMMTDAYVASLPNEYGVRRMWPIARDYFLTKGIDVLAGGTEVACFAHAVNGGIRVNARGESTLPGLYAAGETAGGPHGADRLGGNMIVTCQVYGRLAGENAAAFAAGQNRAAGADAEEFARAFAEIDPVLHAGVDAGAIRKQIGELGQKHLLVRRTGAGLREFLAGADALEKEFASAPAASAANAENASAHNLLAAARLMAEAALLREESRGSHFREDFPETRAEFAKAKVQRK